jgi:hypothetical protein
MLFVLSSVVVFNMVVYFMPKKIPRIELYTTSLFAAVFQLTADIVLGFKYHAYWYFGKGVDFGTFLIIFGLYPQVNMIFLNFFPYNKKHKLIYILGWSVFALFYEWLIVKINVFHYGVWKLWYSIPVYPLLYFILFLNLLFIRRLNRMK